MSKNTITFTINLCKLQRNTIIKTLHQIDALLENFFFAD